MSDGWEDDDDLALLDDSLHDGEGDAAAPANNPSTLDSSPGGRIPDHAWDDDDDLLIDDDQEEEEEKGFEENPQSQLQDATASQAVQSLAEELYQYVSSIPSRVAHVNAQLDRDCNTMDKAQ